VYTVAIQILKQLGHLRTSIDFSRTVGTYTSNFDKISMQSGGVLDFNIVDQG